MDGFELVNVELLVDDANLEVDVVGRGQIDADLVDVEPEEALDLYSLQAADGTVAQLPRYGLLVVHQVVELHVARLVQMDDESTVLLRQRVVGDCVR